ncbi:MAG TPA: phosphate acyltransferase PlsX [Kiritimatiellia bacterium]|nr:phosphate acyltransferase PlsX [Kiritimatiellia bacterium]
MRIAVDAMGGDFAPREIVAGAVQAARDLKHIETLFLVGDTSAIQAELAKHGPTPSSIEIVHASQVVGMDESPATAVRKKKDSSIARSVDLVKEKKADAVFSAGSTGAAVASCQLKLRTLEGVIRPAIAAVFPSPTKPFLLIDAGATPDCTPEILLQFAVMGSAYSQKIMGVDKPRVGLMSIGEEDAKGNETTKETFGLIEKSHLNFAGNIEGHDLFEGEIDVVVCDGFVGNVILKTSESVGHAISTWIKQEFTQNPIRILGAMLLRGALKSFKKKINPEAYGGAPLLGINGICGIGHGSSSAYAAYNGIRAAAEAVKYDINQQIVDEVRKLKGAE